MGNACTQVDNVEKGGVGFQVPCQVSFDFHGLKEKECKEFVDYSLKYHPKRITGQVVQQYVFIPGKGHHSVDNVAILKPMVLERCKELGYKAEVNQFNEGQILVNL